MAASSENFNSCSSLESQFPGQVSYAQDASYRASISSYFYQQARLAPQCIVFPKSASDVSRIVKTISELRAKAAVRGGGHTPIANAANLNNAVTIDLSGMNTVSLGTAHTLGIPFLHDDSGSSISAASNVPFVPSNFASSKSDHSFSNLSSDAASEKISLSTPDILSAGGGATWGDVSGLPVVRPDYQSGRSGPCSPTTLTGRSKVLDALPGTVQLSGRTVWTDSPMLINFIDLYSLLGLGVGLNIRREASCDLTLTLTLDQFLGKDLALTFFD